MKPPTKSELDALWDGGELFGFLKGYAIVGLSLAFIDSAWGWAIVTAVAYVLITVASAFTCAWHRDKLLEELE